MSRYYKIAVGPTATGSTDGFTWTNQIDGKAVLGAQNVEFDIWQTPANEPASNSYIKIWGPFKQQLFQAKDFNGAPIQVFIGMQNGLPLASAAVADGQQGLAVTGQVFQAFGNWQGTNQTLDFILSPAFGTQSNPLNISFNLPKGQPLSSAINSVLKTAFPTFLAPDIQINPDLVLGQDEPFTYQTLKQFGDFINGISQDIVGGDYQGVFMVPRNNQIVVFDGTQKTVIPAKQIKAQDMIGQITWLGPNVVSFAPVMRTDILVGTIVKFPAVAGLSAVTNVNSGSLLRAKTTFQGDWQVKLVRHVGNARQPDATSWVSNFQAVANIANPDLTSVSNGSE